MTEWALIYTRISDASQSGLLSQEHRCRTHVEAKNYLLDGVFSDDVSGGGNYLKRRGLVALLSHIEANPNKKFVVVFDDMKRFSRDTYFYLELIKKLREMGARLECLNFNIQDTPEGDYTSIINIATGELERRVNKRQSDQKSIARLQMGIWAHRSPLGYEFKNVPPHGNFLVRTEPVASILENALKGYENGSFATISEVRRFLERHPEFPKGRNGKVHPQRVKEILTRKLYAGVYEAPHFGIGLTKGLHEPLITYEQFKNIQARLEGRNIAPARKDLNEDFPLRGSVLCGNCGKPLTSNWSRGRSASYPYYLCRTKGCDQNGLSIRKETMEGEFESILRNLTPPPSIFGVVERGLSLLWDHRREYEKSLKKEMQTELIQLEKDIQRSIDRFMDATSQRVTQSIERRIEKLEEQKLLTQEKIAQCGRPLRDFDKSFRTALEFLANPLKLWVSGEFPAQQTCLKLTLAESLVYDRNIGFRTAETTLPFNYLAAFSGKEKEMVPRGGIEPPTRGFSIPCSTD